MNRREVLRGIGLSLLIGKNVSVHAKNSPVTGARNAIRQIVHIILDGGFSQELWNPQPTAPLQVRGPFHCIDTAVPGVQFAELCPHLAKIADKLTIAHTVTSPSQFHDSSTASLLRTADNAHYLERAGESRSRNAFPLAYLESSFAGKGDGLVGIPNGVRDINVREHKASAKLELIWVGDRYMMPYYPTDDRELRRRSPLRTALNDAQLMHSVETDLHHSQWELAEKMLMDGIDVQSDITIEQLQKYGKSKIGHALLTAKSLIRAGVSCVDVNIGHWDFHDQIVRLLNLRYPDLDQGIAAFIDDIEIGEMPETVVCVSTEFGRSPQISVTGGREHWPDAHTELFYGGAFPRGKIVGQTDTMWKPKKGPLIPNKEIQYLVKHAAGHELPREKQIEIGHFFA